MIRWEGWFFKSELIAGLAETESEIKLNIKPANQSMFNVYDSSADCYCVEFPIDNYRNISPGGQGYQSVVVGARSTCWLERRLCWQRGLISLLPPLPDTSAGGGVWHCSQDKSSAQCRGGGGHRLTLELELTSPSEISQSYVTTSQHTFLLGDFSPVLQQVIQDQRNYRE